MGRIRGHLQAGGRGGVSHRRSHGTNSKPLTSYEVRGEGKWSAEIAWDEFEVTYTLGGERRGELVRGIAWDEFEVAYILQGSGRGELVSGDRMGRIRGRLHPARWRERGVGQRRSHETNSRSLTR